MGTLKINMVYLEQTSVLGRMMGSKSRETGAKTVEEYSGSVLHMPPLTEQRVSKSVTQ